jgi:hypothetical protein
MSTIQYAAFGQLWPLSDGYERHPLAMATDLQALADRFALQLPGLRERVREALGELRAAQNGICEARGWAAELEARYDLRRQPRCPRRAPSPQEIASDPVVQAAAEHLRTAALPVVDPVLELERGVRNEVARELAAPWVRHPQAVDPRDMVGEA